MFYSKEYYQLNNSDYRVLNLIGIHLSDLVVKTKLSSYNTQHCYVVIFGMCVLIPLLDLKRFMVTKYRPNYTNFLSLLGEENGHKMEN